ncbi:MAG: PAS domain-containing sensor histidine kinase [Candidatus Auribacterota bacterium]|jgi:PAS domain S-box-containing protein|nr:PAS domain-containing sensor histidine kinase [Candidatus Auribacterota bacterium]
MKLKIESYEKILNAIIEGVAIIDDMQHPIYWNDAFLALTGYDSAALESRRELLDVFPDKDQAIMRELLRSGINGQEFALNTTVRNKNNIRRKTVLCRLHVVQDTDSERKRLCIILASLKDMEENDPNGVPREINALRKAFISNVSHELRTPAAIIREAVSLLADTTLGELNQSQLHFIGMAVKNVDRLTSIINHLLDIALFEKNSVDVTLEQVDLRMLIAQMQKKYCHIAEEKSLILIWQCDEHLPEMLTDGTKLLYILNNLIKNAVQFSREGGEIVIRIDKSADGNNVIMMVKDNGCGIPSDEREKIFDMFYQFNRVPGPGERGIGIGLAVVNRLAQLLKGKVDLESEEGKGSTFIVTIPMIYE